jgi:hypothetical protein
VAIPNLGQLRQLPLAERDSSVDPAVPVETSSWRRAGFLVLGLVAVASLVIAGFCGIRWSLVEVPFTTESHIAEVRKQYRETSAAQLIREYEQMEKLSLDLTGPYTYKKAEMKRDKWGQNASIAAAIGGLAILGAIALAVSGGRNRM